LLHHVRPANRCELTMTDWNAKNEFYNASISCRVYCAAWNATDGTLDVVIQKELVGMRAQTDFVDLARPLIA
jgi:hypothetical protein